MIVRLPSPVDAPTVTAALDAAFREFASGPAIVTASRSWTYDDLAATAHGVAAGLLRSGLATTGASVVAVVLDRSAEFVATVLGVLAAGATYLPLDPQAPDGYLRQVLEEARPALVVTSASRADRIRTGTTAPVCAYPDLLAGPATEMSGTRPAEPPDAAYVIYTSGSTGTPKGVVVPHTALLNSTAARADVYGPAGRVPLLHSPGFDLTTGVLFWTLLTGGTLIIESAPLVDVSATVDLINRHQVTHLIYPASLYGVLLDRIAARRPASLTAVGIGSERWSPALIGRHAALVPGVSLVNEYGPTEACVCSSYAVVYDRTSGRQAPMSIGSPVRNTDYLILDADGRPARSGELVITGANLATGYLNRDQLTAQRFITVGGRRGYRTGDLVEQAPDGTFVFLGRADRQIQIGGHRVEPGHVETVLMGHPAIMQAHVAPRAASDGGDAAALIAYLVPIPGLHRPGSDDTTFIGDCDRFLRERLPSYLVPAAYAVLVDLPRTTAGKIDDRRLPDPVDTVHDRGDDGDGGDVLQRGLAAQAAAILGIAHLPASAPLAQLGVNSLALIRLAAAITADHGVDVPISALFAAQTISDVADLVRTAAPAARTIEPGSVEPAGGYPLSGQQTQIWVLTQLAPDARAYNTQFSLDLHGPVDVGALQTALTHVVGRHEILRTTFHDSATGPVQVVHPPWQATIGLVDLTGLDEADRDAALANRMQAAVGVGFDVAVLPLVRWHLFRLAENRWRLLQVEHHFAHDGWSAQLFLTELRDAYTAILDGREPDLPALTVQYRDYAGWYDRWRTTADFTAYADYWKNQLDGCPADGATFTPDRPRPPVRSFRGDRIDTHIPAVVVQRVDDLAARHGVSRFAVFLAAFALQVWQHTGTTDIVIGSALANRRLPGTAELLGMFVNALPLRVHVDPDASVAGLLDATMGMLLGAQDHQELPLLDLLAHLDRPRDPGHNPLFNVMFAFHDTPRPQLRMGPVQAQLIIEHNATAKGDVNVVCVPDPDHEGSGPGGMTILWEYDTDLFTRATADRLLSGFATILRLLPDTTERTVRQLDLLGADETARLLAISSGRQEPLPHDTLHAGFTAAAAAQPDAVAVLHHGSRWTYRELDERAAVLHAHLAATGMRPGDVVAVACPPGADLITAILAVLRSAAVYVCLDPDHPTTRTGEILTDSGAHIIITSNTVVDPDIVGPRTVITADHLPPLDATTGTSTSEAGPDDGAYLVYTSGSTGTPKAVVATHRNACTAVHARTRFLHDADTQPGPVTTLITLPAIFDVGPHMMMWTLWSGGTIVFPDNPKQTRDADALLALIDTAQITHVNFTASFYRRLLAAIPDGWQPRLRVVAVGGEPCTPDDVRTHAALLPAIALDHEYGPTEGTVWCTAQRLHPASPSSMSRVSVGGPLANYTVAVLDPAGHLAPAGAAGELVIGGPGVAVGYHRRPDLTDQRFVTPADGPFAGQRLYLTGDRALLADTGFEILGRTDDQVKIRGFRIELGEITNQLRAHPDVTDAAVLVHGAGDAARLIAYAATPGSPTGFGDRLRTWLTHRLPTYMIPAVFMVTDHLPRTSTGKIDTRNLAAVPAAGSAEPGHGPSTDQQWLLAQVWRDVLAQPALGIDDDFFAAGGDSLQAIQATARITALGVTVSVADLIAAPTVRALDILLANRPASASMTVTDRRPAGTILTTTPVQEWFFHLNLADPDHFHQARLFRIPTHGDLGRLRAALAWAADRHDAFRTRFTRTDRTWTPVLADRALPDLIRDYTLSADSGRPAAEQLDELLRDLHEHIRIADGRLAAFAIVHGPAGQRWLYLIAHHLVVDVVSWQILTADIEQAYQLLTDARPLPHGSAPGVPSFDSTTAPSAPDRRRWQALAAAATPRLGTGRPSTATLAERIRLTRQLSARTGTYLRLEVPRLHGIGAQAVLLAALKRAIGPVSTGIGLYVWLEGHGRTNAGTHGADHVVGWLTSLHPALFMVDDAMPARLVDAATSIHGQISTATDAAAGFGEVVLRDPSSALYRQLAAAGLPQITFNYLGQPADTTGRLLQPVAGPEGATIGTSNVLPTPFDLTVAPASDGTVTCRFSVDPTVLDPAQAAQVADRFAADLEAAARLVPLTAARVGPARRTLFLIHPVGGLLDWYGPLVKDLGTDWECYGIPRDRACTDTTMQSLARRYLALIRAAKPDGPYAVGGWCLGGPLAYEIARQAQADGDGNRIDEVILLDPPRAEQPRNPHDVLVSHIHNACPHQHRNTVVEALAATDHLSVEQRATALVDLLGPSGAGRPDPQLLSQLVMRLTDHAAMSAWQPTTTVGRMTLYIPQTLTPDHDDAAATWQPYSRELTAVTIPGDHESMLVAAELAHHIDTQATPAGDGS